MNTLIIGCGKLGIPLGIKLCEAGHHVTGLRRNISQIPSPIVPFSQDLSKKELNSSFLENFDLVYIILSPQERSESGYKTAYEEIAPRIAKSFKKVTQSQRIIWTSSSHVYSENSGEWVNEKTKTQAYDYRSRSLIIAENSLLELNTNQNKGQSIVCRFSGLYEGKSHYIQKQIETGQAIKNPLGYTNRLHREDAVGFLYHLGTKVKKPATLYLASDSKPQLRKDIFQAVAEHSDDLIFEEQSDLTGKRCSNQQMLSTGYILKHPYYLHR